MVVLPYNSFGLPDITKARLGHVTPLDHPRSVYKRDVECRFLSRNGQMTLNVKVKAPYFKCQLKVFHNACLVKILVISAQICDELSCGQGKVHDKRTDGQTDRRRQWQYPFGMKGQWAKKRECVMTFLCSTVWHCAALWRPCHWTFHTRCCLWAVVAGLPTVIVLRSRALVMRFFTFWHLSHIIITLLIYVYSLSFCT